MATGTAIGQKGNWRGRYALTYTQTATTTKVVCNFYVEHVSGAGKLSRYHYRGTFDGTNGSTYYPTTAALGGNGNGKGETVAIGSVTKTYNKTHSAQSLSKTVKVTNTDTDGYVSKSITVSVPAKTSYAISYNANGGSWTGTAPSTTKWHDESITTAAADTVTRIGYKFIGWKWKDAGDLVQPSTSWNAANETGSFYAQWEAIVVRGLMKINNVWEEGTFYIKINGVWIEPTTCYVKINGSWTEMT